MTAHMHTSVVAGCHRCEIGQDEAMSAALETAVLDLLRCWHGDVEERPCDPCHLLAAKVAGEYETNIWVLRRSHMDLEQREAAS